jgi:monoamine oxidase
LSAAARPGSRRRLNEAGIACLIVEARPRLGGRAWTIDDGAAFPIDLGCGWLHSADRNPGERLPRRKAARSTARRRPGRAFRLRSAFRCPSRRAFSRRSSNFHQRLGALAEDAPDVPAATLLEPRGRWNALINAVGTYASSSQLERVSTRDFSRYHDSGVNWRVVEGLLREALPWPRGRVDSSVGQII